MRKKKSPKKKAEVERRLVVVPLSMWMADEFEAEMVRSLERESTRMAQEDAADCQNSKDDEPLEREDISGILEDMSDFLEMRNAAEPDYVAAVAEVLCEKLKLPLDLTFQSSGEDGIIASISIDAAAKLHAASEAKGHKRLRAAYETMPDDDWIAKPIEDWSVAELSALLEIYVDTDSVQMKVIDHLASSTDALCCDRLLDHVEYERRTTELREVRRAEKERDEALEMGESIH
jgi:hypothetical protein